MAILNGTLRVSTLLPAMRKPLQNSAIFAAVAAGAAVLFLFNPATSVFYPRCLFHETTGLYCPGCGSTRALYWLLHGKPGRALHENALAILAIPLLGAWVACRYLRRRPPVMNPRFRLMWVVVMLGVVVAFGVLRNFPVRPFSWLAPPVETK